MANVMHTEVDWPQNDQQTSLGPEGPVHHAAGIVGLAAIQVFLLDVGKHRLRDQARQ